MTDRGKTKTMTDKSKSKRVTKKAAPQPDQVVEMVAADKIVPGANHRQHFDPIALKELADSIREHGLAQPITVRPFDDGRYQIVAGERRYRAMSQILEWERIPCLVKEMSDEQAEVIMGIENLQREDLLPMEEAEIYKRQVDKGKSAREIAKLFGVSDTKVRSRLALLDLLPEFQRLVNQGALPLAHAERMAELGIDRQRAAVKWLQEQSGTPTLKVFGQYVDKLLAAQNQASLFDLSFFASPVVDEAVQQAEGSLKKVLPRRPDLPELEVTNSLGELADQYAAKLMEAGRTAEAQVILDFWCKAMDFNWMRLDAHSSLLLQQFGDRLLADQQAEQVAAEGGEG